MKLGIEIGGITYNVEIETEDDFVTEVNSVEVRAGLLKYVKIAMTRDELDEFYKQYVDELNERYERYMEAVRDEEAEQRYGKDN